MALLNHGTTLHVTDDGKSAKVGVLRAIGEVKLENEMVDVTTLDAPGGFRMYMPGLKTAGDLGLDGFLDAEDEGQAILRSQYFSGREAEYVIQYPDGERCAFKALVKILSVGGGEVDAVVRFSAVLKLTGEVEFQ